MPENPLSTRGRCLRGRYRKKQMIPGAHKKKNPGAHIRSEEELLIMKKHVLLLAALCMTAVMATACGSKHTQTQENAAETTTEAADAENESGGHDKTGSFQCGSEDGGRSGERSRQMRALKVYRWRRSPVRSWRSSRVRWLQSLKNGLQVLRKGACRDREGNKDMEGLADHIDFPAFISCVEDKRRNGGYKGRFHEAGPGGDLLR